MIELTDALPGIWFWEADHPDWTPGDGWDPTVRSWVIASGDGLLFVDPLLPDGAGPGGAWEPLDALVADHGPVAGVIRTLHYHHRSVAQVSAHYDVPIYAREPPRPGVPHHPLDRPLADGGRLPGGIGAHHVDRDDEVVLWLPDQRALLFSDVGQRRHGRFELCPQHWVHPPDRLSRLTDQLRDLSVHEAEHLLVSHGEHRLRDGGELPDAIARARAQPLPPFVSWEDYRARRPGAKLIDARLYLDGRSERAAYEAAHLPGAVWLDFAATLSDPPGPDARGGRHPLPDPERFAAGLAAAGVSAGDTVVAYDDAGGVMAARLVWLLRILGEDAALLTPVPPFSERGSEAAPAAGRFPARPWPAERFADAEQVAARDPDTVLLDARDPARFAGGPDPFEPRSGHIPGAVNLPARANLDADGELLDLRTLEARLTDAGIHPGTEVISSCGSGVTACHNLLMFESLHHAPGRLYVGSFSEWSRDPARPVETGA